MRIKQKLLAAFTAAALCLSLLPCAGAAYEEYLPHVTGFRETGYADRQPATLTNSRVWISTAPIPEIRPMALFLSPPSAIRNTPLQTGSPPLQKC